MVLIFGGVYQGKLDYAIERFGLCEADVFRCSEDECTAPGHERIIYEIDKWILALVRAEQDTDAVVKRFIENNKNTIVICNDISCGVVPVDPIMRVWRESVGRALAEFAGASDEVVRIFCGIPAVLK